MKTYIGMRNDVYNEIQRECLCVLSRSHGAYPMAEIGEYFGVHYVTVSRAVRVLEDADVSDWV